MFLHGEEHKLNKLKKAHSRLKQAPHAWYSQIEAYFLKEGFEKCDYRLTLFVKREKGELILIDLTNLRKMRYFLDLVVLQKLDDISYVKRNMVYKDVTKVQNG